MREHGSLQRIYWYNAGVRNPDLQQTGEMLFGQNCSTCHTIGGLNNMQTRFQDRPEDAIYVILGHTNELVPWMPPFSGNDQERRLLARYLYEISHKQDQYHGIARLPEPVRSEHD